MADVIKLVSGDTRPSLRITLTDANTKLPVNLTGVTAVKLQFREQGGDTTLFVADGYLYEAAKGAVEVPWPTDVAPLAAGQYEADVKVTFPDGTVQTTFDLIRFMVRDGVRTAQPAP